MNIRVISRVIISGDIRIISVIIRVIGRGFHRGGAVVKVIIRVMFTVIIGVIRVIIML